MWPGFTGYIILGIAGLRVSEPLKISKPAIAASHDTTCGPRIRLCHQGDVGEEGAANSHDRVSRTEEAIYVWGGRSREGEEKQV